MTAWGIAIMMRLRGTVLALSTVLLCVVPHSRVQGGVQLILGAGGGSNAITQDGVYYERTNNIEPFQWAVAGSVNLAGGEVIVDVGTGCNRVVTKSGHVYEKTGINWPYVWVDAGTATVASGADIAAIEPGCNYLFAADGEYFERNGTSAPYLWVSKGYIFGESSPARKTSWGGVKTSFR